MPIPLITTKILNSGVPALPGWSLLEFNDVRAAQAASGNSTNYFFEFTILAGPQNSMDNKDKSVTFMVSGAALAAGIEDTCGAYYQMLSCLTGVPAADLVGVEVDENALKGKKAWADIKKKIYEGKEQNDFKAFMPPDTTPF